MTTIINNRPRIYECEGVRLMPGPNTVDAKSAEKLLAHKAVTDRIEIGHLTVVETPKASGKPSMPKTEGK